MNCKYKICKEDGLCHKCYELEKNRRFQCRFCLKMFCLNCFDGCCLFCNEIYNNFNEL